MLITGRLEVVIRFEPETDDHDACDTISSCMTPRKAVVVQLLSPVLLFATLWTAALQASLSFTVSPSLLQLMTIWVSDAIQPSHSVMPFSFFPQSIPELVILGTFLVLICII